MSMGIREEFRLKKFGFSDVATERFCSFQWRSPGLLYLIYRLLVAAYTLTWLIITSSQFSVHGSVTQGFSAYLTDWTYTLLTIYFLCHALVALVAYLLCRGSGLRLTHRRRPEEHRNLFHELQFTSSGYEEIRDDSTPPEIDFVESTRLPWYMIIVWILFSTVSVGALMVSIVFWGILVPTSTELGLITNLNLQLHLVNSILILLEHALTAVPVRLLHVVYPILYGSIYMLFSLFYWVEDHSHVMYDILDWNKPGPTVGYVFLVGFVIMPLIHLFIYGIYRLKIFIFRKLY